MSSHLPDEFLSDDENAKHDASVMSSDVKETIELREKGELDSAKDSIFNAQENYAHYPHKANNDRVVEKRGVSLVVVIAIIIIIISNVFTAGIFFAAKEPVKYFLDVPDLTSLGKFRQEVTQKLDVINERSRTTENKVGQLENTISSLSPQLIELQNGVEKVSRENAELKAEKNQLENNLAQLKEQQKVVKAVAIQKQIEALPPKLILVSVRSESGVSFVTLRDGDERSPLLTKGDIWHDWELTLVDLNGRKAFFNVKGKAMELTL